MVFTGSICYNETSVKSQKVSCLQEKLFDLGRVKT